jgi:hypothetical protein
MEAFIAFMIYCIWLCFRPLGVVKYKKSRKISKTPKERHDWLFAGLAMHTWFEEMEDK